MKRVEAFFDTDCIFPMNRSVQIKKNAIRPGWTTLGGEGILFVLTSLHIRVKKNILNIGTEIRQHYCIV